MAKVTENIEVIVFAFLSSILFMCSYVQAESPHDRIKQDMPKAYKEQIEADGYKYTYEAVPTRDEVNEIIYTGKITVRDKDDNNKIIYEEITGLDPTPGACGDFPAVSKLPAFKISIKKGKDNSSEETVWLVIFCGSSGQRHQTLKIFSTSGFGNRSTSMDFEDTEPNLSEVKGIRGYVAELYRRILFPDYGNGLDNCLMVYRLNIDDALSGGNYFGFVPVFGPEMAKPYLDYYMWQKKELRQRIKKDKETPEDIKIDLSQDLGQILSALISTQDKKTICAEIKKLRTYGLTTKDLLIWMKRIKDVGYPGFDINLCKRK